MFKKKLHQKNISPHLNEFRQPLAQCGILCDTSFTVITCWMIVELGSFGFVYGTLYWRFVRDRYSETPCHETSHVLHGRQDNTSKHGILLECIEHINKLMRAFVAA